MPHRTMRSRAASRALAARTPWSKASSKSATPLTSRAPAALAREAVTSRAPAAPAREAVTSRATAAPARRHVSAAIRREVWARDAGRCAYTDDRGRRCPGTGSLQLHHREAHAMGGPDSVDNLELRCPLCRMRHKGHYAAFGFMPHVLAQGGWASGERISYAA